MSQKNNSLLGTLVLLSGIVIGAAGALFYKENKAMEPNTVLDQIKKQFALQGEVTGSWIDYDPIEYTAFQSLPLVYTGGISRKEDGKIVSYHFVADIYTGEVLNIY